MTLDSTIGSERWEISSLKSAEKVHEAPRSKDSSQTSARKKARNRRRRQRRKNKKAAEKLACSASISDPVITASQPARVQRDGRAPPSAYAILVSANKRADQAPQRNSNVDKYSSPPAAFRPAVVHANSKTQPAQPSPSSADGTFESSGSTSKSSQTVQPAFSLQPDRYTALPRDFEDDSDVEETVVTKGAATWSRPRPGKPKVHPQALADESITEKDPNDSHDSDDDEADGQHADSEPAPIPGFPPLEELPTWFPEKIKKIYTVDRHGGALKFKVGSPELDDITRYRASLEITLRRRWKTYLKAGEARYKLQNLVRRLRARSPTRAFLDHRVGQYKTWRARALRAWKALETMHLAVSVLDSTIHVNFRQERIIYEKKLAGWRR